MGSCGGMLISFFFFFFNLPGPPENLDVVSLAKKPLDEGVSEHLSRMLI